MQKIRFFGFEGYHAVDYGKRELVSLCRKNSAGGKVEISANPVEVKILDPLEEEIRSFIEAVISRNPPPVTGKEGRDALELALLIAKKVKLSQELLP
jgi:predicted dehydrogenase